MPFVKKALTCETEISKVPLYIHTKKIGAVYFRYAALNCIEFPADKNESIRKSVSLYAMDTATLLKTHVAKLASLTAAEFEHFYSHFTPISFKKGQMVIREGDKVDCEYFVVDGCLKTFYINYDVKMHILQFAMSTWWASDYQALYSGNRATVNVDCITDADLLILSNADREKLCSEIPQVGHFFRWRTNRGYVAAHKRLLSFMNNDAKTRYEELMQLYPQLYNIVPKHLIAAYLGVSRETLSRLYNNHKNVI